MSQTMTDDEMAAFLELLDGWPARHGREPVNVEYDVLVILARAVVAAERVLRGLPRERSTHW